MAPSLPPPVEFEIDGRRFRLTVLDATRGSPLYVKLLKVLGPALIALFTSGDPTAERSWAGAINDLLRALEPELVAEMQREFSAFCQVETDGQWPYLKDNFRFYFAGKYLLMTKWLVECCRVNFSDFFELGSLTSALGSLASTSK